MPGPALITAVPGRSQGANFVQVLPDATRAGPLSLALVFSLMHVWKNRSQIGDVVVERVVVQMVDVVTGRDCPVVVLPYFPVQRLHASANVATARREISLMVEVGRKRVSAEPDPVENDGLDLVGWQALWHTEI